MVAIYRIERRLRAYNRYLSVFRERAVSGEDLTSADREDLLIMDKDFDEFMEDLGINPFKNREDKPKDAENDPDRDNLVTRAIRIGLIEGHLSLPKLQAHLGIGYCKSMRLMETLEEYGIIAEPDGTKVRHMLIRKVEDE